MNDTHQLDGQHTAANLDECLGRLAHVLKAMGIEELSIEGDGHFHLTNSEHPADQRMVNSFCQHVTEMYRQVKAAR